MEKAATRSYEECVVHEAIVFHEGIESKDDFGYPQNTKPPEGGIRAPDKLPVEAGSPDYSKQLQFHEAELAQAEQRGFPPGQVEYHAGKIACLRELLAEAEVISVDFIKKERL